MASASVHTGSIDTIPAGATPGLLFLKELLPSWDALGKPPKPVRAAGPGQARREARQVLPHRHGRLRHWQGGRTRTVIFEAVNSRVLKNDPGATEVKGKEVTILELKPVDGKLVAVEVRTTLENHAMSVHQRKIGGAGAA
ncbi:hypothetical protein G7054_g8762 [Neopestalotiopsis clavispora]|nr:hypothetical protein G7054_g8762 [Neopestalotiopsis clavispora]